MSFFETFIIIILTFVLILFIKAAWDTRPGLAEPEVIDEVAEQIEKNYWLRKELEAVSMQRAAERLANQQRIADERKAREAEREREGNEEYGWTGTGWKWD